jgi:hypothetical protein
MLSGGTFAAHPAHEAKSVRRLVLVGSIRGPVSGFGSRKSARDVAGSGSEPLLLQSIVHGFHDCRFVRELAGLELRVDQLAIHGDLETSAGRRDQSETLDLRLESGQQLVRQTDGLRLVTSDRTILHFDVHHRLGYWTSPRSAGNGIVSAMRKPRDKSRGFRDASTARQRGHPARTERRNGFSGSSLGP